MTSTYASKLSGRWDPQKHGDQAERFG
ncbi:hypothetical protein CCACVL1_27139 [Corchorus capsularis]|uniref:Uncharacterized protein n=1 Tax=Corchorus capsularis TaxID=210143 RepID=A0A1R3GC42_COCAP|nr:hypothetical protein CCACVL1_27139 [Corchorus capsularis]